MKLRDLFETTNTDVSFHETSVPAAIKILTSGSIDPLYVHAPHMRDEYMDMGAFDDDDELDDYGAWVYTSVFSWADNYKFYGSNENHVMFVIDASAVTGDKQYTPNKEGGLLKIKGSVPVVHIKYALVCDTTHSADIKKLTTTLTRASIPHQVVAPDRYEVIRRQTIDQHRTAVTHQR